MRNFLSTISLALFCSFLTAQSTVKISTEDARKDLVHMVNTFEDVHYNPYFKHSKEEVDQIKKIWTRDWVEDSISLKQFMVVGFKLSAMMSGGHSMMDWNNPKIIPGIKTHMYLPFTGELIDGEFVVTKSHHDLIKQGSKITSINGINMTVLFKECMSYVGGIDAFKSEQIKTAFPLYLYFNDSLKPPYAINVLGRKEAVLSNGLNVQELSDMLNSTVQQVDYTFEILNDQVGLISYNSCHDYKKFDNFLKESFKSMHLKKIDKLIIDIRNNGGGNSDLNELLLAYITNEPYRQSGGRYWKVSEESKKAYSSHKAYGRIFGKKFMKKYMTTPDGEIIASLDTANLIYPKKPKYYFQGSTCMLIGPGTFSSANFLADAVKTYEITTLIGAPTGEYTNDFGEQLSFVLPKSGSTVFISSTYDIGANGDHTIFEPVHPNIQTEEDALAYALKWITKK